MASINAKLADQLKDKIGIEEQKLVPIAKVEADLFCNIEEECIKAINMLYEDSGFVAEAPQHVPQSQEAQAVPD